MKTTKLILSVAFSIYWSLGTSLFAQQTGKPSKVTVKEELHIYLLIGQSNMAGRSPFTEQEAGVIERCYLLNDKDQWEGAKNPLNRYSTIGKALRMQKLNPGYTFSKTMLESDKNISIGLVVNAKGGTKIDQWKKGSQFYKEAIKRAQTAQKSGVLKGVLWHQGEGNRAKPAGYLSKLEKLVEDLRKDLKQPSLPFVAGQINQSDESKEINEQIAGLAETTAFTGVASSEGLTTMDKSHFDSKGMKLLGKRYAEAMLKIQAKAQKKSSLKR